MIEDKIVWEHSVVLLKLFQVQHTQFTTLKYNFTTFFHLHLANICLFTGTDGSTAGYSVGFQGLPLQFIEKAHGSSPRGSFSTCIDASAIYNQIRLRLLPRQDFQYLQLHWIVLKKERHQQTRWNNVGNVQNPLWHFINATWLMGILTKTYIIYILHIIPFYTANNQGPFVLTWTKWHPWRFVNP